MKSADVNIPAKSGDKQKKGPGKNLFKPGQSGNPKGRPKGTFSIVGLLKNALQKKAVIEGKKINKTYADLFVEKWMNNTIVEGDSSLMKETAAHIDGMPARRIDITSAGEPISGFNYIVPEEAEE